MRKELKEYCEREGFNYGNVKNPYSEINSAGIRKGTKAFSDKHVGDIEPYFSDNIEHLKFVQNLKLN